MENKKIGTITLEYDRGDGVLVSEAFQGELNNAIFNGNVSAMEGTFKGLLTANAINAVKNLNLAGRATAITTVGYVGYVGGIFNDDGVWRVVSQLAFDVPSADQFGGWVSTSFQYRISDSRGDNDLFLTKYRIVIDGVVIWESPVWSKFMYFYRAIKYFYHEVAARVTGPGTHIVSLQYKWGNIDTNVYPEFFDITMRTDYIRK